MSNLDLSYWLSDGSAVDGYTLLDMVIANLYYMAPDDPCRGEQEDIYLELTGECWDKSNL